MSKCLVLIESSLRTKKLKIIILKHKDKEQKQFVSESVLLKSTINTIWSYLNNSDNSFFLFSIFQCKIFATLEIMQLI